MPLVSFGIPIPINPDNVFNISKKTWLLGQVPVPEGALGLVARHTLDADARKIKAVLDGLFPESMLVISEAPLHYKFCINGDFVQFGSPEYKLAMNHMPPLKVVTLRQILKFFSSIPANNRDDFTEFLELVRDYCPVNIERLKQDFPYLNQLI